MSSTTNIHPDAVFEALLAKPSRSNVKRTLNALHDICREHHAVGGRDFSIAGIGRKTDEAGLIGYRSLYNPASQIYRDLIQAWAAYAGPSISKPAKTLASHEYLLKIHDPAIRTIMQGIIAERDSLKTQMNLIKGSTLGIINRRPIGATIVSNPEAGPTAILMPAAQLNEIEREALKAAISPEFLKDQEWLEGARGEIKTANGRPLFKLGFTSAIRRILGEQPQPGVKVVS